MLMMAREISRGLTGWSFGKARAAVWTAVWCLPPGLALCACCALEETFSNGACAACSSFSMVPHRALGFDRSRTRITDRDLGKDRKD